MAEAAKAAQKLDATPIPLHGTTDPISVCDTGSEACLCRPAFLESALVRSHRYLIATADWLGIAPQLVRIQFDLHFLEDGRCIIRRISSLWCAVVNHTYI